MLARVSPGAQTVEDAMAAPRREGCSAPRGWSDGPCDRYGWHEHDYHKVLFCLEGSIVFHTEGGDIALHAGDRLDLGAGTKHAATVGSKGCRCVGATKPPEPSEPSEPGAVSRAHPYS